jgi:magnesium transporter
VEEARIQKDDIIKSIEELVEKEDLTVLKTMLPDLHPADIADVVTRLDRNQRQSIINLLETERAAEVIESLDTPVRKDLLESLPENLVAEIIGTMDSDDATDVMGELEDDLADRILEAMPGKEHREVETLLRHDEETAGGIMALEIVAVEQGRTAKEALAELRKKADEVDDVYNIYAVDDKGKLKGVISLKDMVLANPRSKLSEIIDKETVTIRPEMDQEEVANIFHKYDLVSAPVVDELGRLVGRITIDDIMDVVKEEANEDITLMAGITDEEIRGQSILRISGVRLPWLLVALVGQLLSALVLRHFDASLKRIAMSAFFIPLIMAMGGNTGIQSATVIIRGLALGEINLHDTWHRLLKELLAALINGIVIALIVFGAAAVWLNEPKFGMVLAVAMVAVLFNAALMGTLIPFLLKRLGADPAIATGPFITTSNDVLGLVVYFGLITLFQNWLLL